MQCEPFSEQFLELFRNCSMKQFCSVNVVLVLLEVLGVMLELYKDCNCGLLVMFNVRCCIVGVQGFVVACSDVACVRCF